MRTTRDNVFWGIPDSDALGLTLSAVSESTGVKEQEWGVRRKTEGKHHRQFFLEGPRAVCSLGSSRVGTLERSAREVLVMDQVSFLQRLQGKRVHHRTTLQRPWPAPSRGSCSRKKAWMVEPFLLCSHRN